jgi:uncharacterized protein YjbI with pentapeptide repeats
VLPDGGAAQPLEQIVRRLLESAARGPVLLTGKPGSGKTTAIAHLRSVLPTDPKIDILDTPPFVEIPRFTDRLGIVGFPDDIPGDWLMRLELVPWCEDDFIEYCAARRRECCPWVLSRLRADDGKELLAGNPQLWRVVLDRLAADETLADAATALREHLHAVLPAGEARDELGEACLRDLTDVTSPLRKSQLPDQLSAYAIDLLRHHAVRVILAADRVVETLAGGGSLDHLTVPPRDELLRQIALLVRRRPEAVERLDKLLCGEDRQIYATAATVRLAADCYWNPKTARWWNLSRARLPRAQWPGVNLRGARLTMADLHDADLSGARLADARLEQASLHHCSLAYATLERALANAAKFTSADLTGASFARADCAFASFARANLHKASFAGAALDHADFSGARLSNTSLALASLDTTAFDDAELFGVDFSKARLRDVRLSLAANVVAPSFHGASLLKCDLEGLRLPAADFGDAELTGSYLTATFIPRGNFNRATLRGAGLAEINWPDADLRDADLRGATFHMGSSRSGLVGSPIACEGSKTGFYTDDFNDQDFKSPEEIRKANLCGADLRGALIDGVDFYLVDLRGAKYTPDQAEHLARCGAILRSRVA